MPNNCCVLQCGNRKSESSRITLHRFPFGDENRMGKWVSLVDRRPTWIPQNSSVICSNHFKDPKLSSRKRMLSDPCLKSITKNDYEPAEGYKIIVDSSQMRSKPELNKTTNASRQLAPGEENASTVTHRKVNQCSQTVTYTANVNTQVRTPTTNTYTQTSISTAKFYTATKSTSSFQISKHTQTNKEFRAYPTSCYFKIEQVLAKVASSFVQDRHLFTNLGSHILNLSTLGNPIAQLIKIISRTYCVVRMHYNAKRETLEQLPQSLRIQNNKLTLFSGA